MNEIGNKFQANKKIRFRFFKNLTWDLILNGAAGDDNLSSSGLAKLRLYLQFCTISGLE